MLEHVFVCRYMQIKFYPDIFICKRAWSNNGFTLTQYFSIRLDFLLYEPLRDKFNKFQHFCLVRLFIYLYSSFFISLYIYSALFFFFHDKFTFENICVCSLHIHLLVCTKGVIISVLSRRKWVGFHYTQSKKRKDKRIKEWCKERRTKYDLYYRAFPLLSKLVHWGIVSFGRLSKPTPSY